MKKKWRYSMWLLPQCLIIDLGLTSTLSLLTSSAGTWISIVDTEAVRDQLYQLNVLKSTEGTTEYCGRTPLYHLFKIFRRFLLIGNKPVVFQPRKKGVREEPGNLSWFRNGTLHFSAPSQGSLNHSPLSHSSAFHPPSNCGGVEWGIEDTKGEAHGLR